eukprot:scaffold274508_cov33-Prasinocladus_malaysianus.AAC.1
MPGMPALPASRRPREWRSPDRAAPRQAGGKRRVHPTGRKDPARRFQEMNRPSRLRPRHPPDSLANMPSKHKLSSENLRRKKVANATNLPPIICGGRLLYGRSLALLALMLSYGYL